VGTVLPESLPADQRPPSVTTALRILTPPQAAQFASAMEDLRVRAHAQVCACVVCVRLCKDFFVIGFLS